MKKRLIAIAAAVVAAACTVTAYAASAEMEGLPVDIQDWDTPAVFAAGKDWPITVWYFYGENGEVLGSIPADSVKDLSQGEPADGTQWEFWLAEAFNDYRKLYGTEEEKTQQSQDTPPAAEPEQEQTRAAGPEVETEQVRETGPEAEAEQVRETEQEAEAEQVRETGQEAEAERGREQSKKPRSSKKSEPSKAGGKAGESGKPEASGKAGNAETSGKAEVIGKAEDAEKSGKAESTGKAGLAGESGKPEVIGKAEDAEKSGKAEATGKAEDAETSGKSEPEENAGLAEESGKAEPAEKTGRAKRSRKSAKAVKAEKSEHMSEPDRSEKSQKSDKAKTQNAGNEKPDLTEEQSGQMTAMMDLKEEMSENPQSVSNATGQSEAPAKFGLDLNAERAILKTLCACISKENLVDFHNALVALLGEEEGKRLYQELKTNAEYASYWSELPAYGLKEKFDMYCKMVFDHSEYAKEPPEDFSGFLYQANGKRKNLNSLRAALQGHYGKDKGMKYYSLFKSHIKMMNRM